MTNMVEGVRMVIKAADQTVMDSVAGLVASLDSGKTLINKEIEKDNLTKPLCKDRLI